MDFNEFMRVIELLQKAYPSIGSNNSEYASYFEQHSQSGHLSCERLLLLFNEMFSPRMDAFPDEIELAFQSMKEGNLHEV